MKKFGEGLLVFYNKQGAVMILNEFTDIKFHGYNITLGIFSNDIENIESYLSLIPDKQKEDIQKYIKESDRIKRLIARANVYKYLYDNHHIKDFSLYIGEFGKLYLRNYPDIYFNFSYSKNYTLVGISNTELGVDIEYIDGGLNIEKLSEIILHPKELSYFWNLNKEEKKNFFYRAFNVKEAIIKSIGTGLYYDIRRISIFDINCRKYTFESYSIILKELNILDEYKVSICLRV